MTDHDNGDNKGNDDNKVPDAKPKELPEKINVIGKFK